MRLVPASFPRAAAAACAVTLAACASTDYHYSQLYGDRYFKAPIDTYPVTIVRIDGKDTAISPVLVDPGVRKVTVLGPRGGGSRLGEEKDISLDVRSGEFFGIAGRNGSGKSTLLKCMAGIYGVDRGRIWMNGRLSTLHRAGRRLQRGPRGARQHRPERDHDGLSPREPARATTR
jgi:hypothetical protein